MKRIKPEERSRKLAWYYRQKEIHEARITLDQLIFWVKYRKIFGDPQKYDYESHFLIFGGSK